MTEKVLDREKLKINLEPAKRCPDYDQDCYDVDNPFRCWCGNTMGLPPAEGFCPLMKKNNGRY